MLYTTSISHHDTHYSHLNADDLLKNLWVESFVFENLEKLFKSPDLTSIEVKINVKAIERILKGF